MNYRTEGSVYSAAQTLILFLKSLCESVIPSYLYFNCINSSVSFSKSKKFLSYLSPVHYHTFWKIVLFLKEILSKNPNISPSKLGNYLSKWQSIFIFIYYIIIYNIIFMILLFYYL